MLTKVAKIHIFHQQELNQYFSICLFYIQNRLKANKCVFEKSGIVSAIVFLIIPKVELAFLDGSAHCLDGFALLCIITPKYLSSSLTINTLPPITYDNSWFPFPRCITEHFSRLNSIYQSCDHLNILINDTFLVHLKPYLFFCTLVGSASE